MVIAVGSLEEYHDTEVRACDIGTIVLKDVC